MSSPVYYFNSSPYRAANIPLPPSPYVSPYPSPYPSPHSSPYGVHLTLPPSPASYAVSVPLPPSPVITPSRSPMILPQPIHPPVTAAQLAAGTHFAAHPLLEFHAQDPTIKWDARRSPATAYVAERPYNSLDRYLNEFALTPPWTFVRIRSALLPWLVEVSNPSGVTVGDVLNAVHSCLRHRVEKDEWRDQSRDFQTRLLDVWKQRCEMAGHEEGRSARAHEQDRGVRRVDWLLWDVEWLGIQRSNTELETWDVHFRSP